MARTATPHPTNVELEILQVLWQSGPAALGEICETLQRERPVAKSTVATMLAIMRTKKLVERTSGSRGPLWRARITRDDVAGTLLNKLVERVFDGSAGRLVAHLLEAGRLSDEDRKELARLLDDRDTPAAGRAGRKSIAKKSAKRAPS